MNGRIDMVQQAHRWNESLTQIRGLLYDLLEEKADTEKIIEIIERLGALDEMYKAAIGFKQDISGFPPISKGRKYRIDKAKGQEYLAEYRSANQQPFRCPARIYESFVDLMSRVSEPETFEKLLGQMRQKSGEDLPDYLLRMCLRFWMGTHPPLVEKNRTRYKARKRSTFKRDAFRAWRELLKPED